MPISLATSQAQARERRQRCCSARHPFPLSQLDAASSKDSSQRDQSQARSPCHSACRSSGAYPLLPSPFGQGRSAKSHILGGLSQSVKGWVRSLRIVVGYFWCRGEGASALGKPASATIPAPSQRDPIMRLCASAVPLPLASIRKSSPHEDLQPWRGGLEGMKDSLSRVGICIPVLRIQTRESQGRGKEGDSVVIRVQKSQRRRMDGLANDSVIAISSALFYSTTPHTPH